jgi:SAM-dependent methyltransferase
MPEDYFGECVAERYDERYAYQSDPAVVDPIVAFLAELARDGARAVLELGIGTGRIALPLAQRGVRVHGIDLSAAMVARLRAKPGAEQIGVTIGDFATTTVEATFSVAYLVANTVMNLTTQDEQVACFRNAAAHLEPGGCFVIEVLVPGLRRLPPGETFQPFDVSPMHLGFDEYDVAR